MKNYVKKHFIIIYSDINFALLFRFPILSRVENGRFAETVNTHAVFLDTWIFLQKQHILYHKISNA